MSVFSIRRRKNSSDHVNSSHSVLTVLRFSSENKQVYMTGERCEYAGMGPRRCCRERH